MAQTKPVATQRPQFYFDKPITLDSLTRYVHSRSKIRFSFNSSKVKGDKVIDLKKGTYSIELLLQQIRKNTSLHYFMYNGYVIFQDNPPKPKAGIQLSSATTTIKPNQGKAAVVNHKKPMPATAAKKGTGKPVVKTTTAPNKAPVSGAATVDTVKHVDTVVTPRPQPPAATPAPPKKKKPIPPAATDKRDAKEEKEKTGWRWQYGLQWKAVVPLYGTERYLTGPNNRSQWYNPFIPGIWAGGLINDQHEILLLIKPAEWYSFQGKELGADTVLKKKDADTVASQFRTSNSLLKTGGIYASLQYNYHINGKLVIGVGVGYYARGQALIQRQQKWLKDGTLLPDSVYSVKNDTLTAKYLSKSMIIGKFEVAYRVGSVDLGASVGLPLTSPFTSNSFDQSRPYNANIFVRWRIGQRSEDN